MELLRNEKQGVEALYGPSGISAMNKIHWPPAVVYPLACIANEVEVEQDQQEVCNEAVPPDTVVCAGPEDDDETSLCSEQLIADDEFESFLCELDEVSVLEQEGINHGIGSDSVEWYGMQDKSWYYKLQEPGLTATDIFDLILCHQRTEKAVQCMTAKRSAKRFRYPVKRSNSYSQRRKRRSMG